MSPPNSAAHRGVGSTLRSSAVAAALGSIAFGWLLWRIDPARLVQIVADADVRFLVAIPLAVGTEQLVRGWKWRQILFPLRPVATLRLFGAIMAGYFANILIPLGISPLIRAWLVARLEELKVSAVLATAAVDRFVDGVVFSGLVALAITFTAFPDPSGQVRFGLVVGGVGGFALFALLLTALYRYKRQLGSRNGWATRAIRRLPAAIAVRVLPLARGFAAGVVWPRERWRSVGVVLASILIKLVATTHFLWAGLAFGVVLEAPEYLFLVVFLGFLTILTRLLRIPGGFLLGAAFALDGLGVREEESLAMAISVYFSSLLTVVVVGALVVWRSGIALAELRTAPERPLGPA